MERRIVLVNPYLGSVPGGIERELIALTNEFIRQGDRVTLVTTPYDFPSGRADLAQPLRYPLSPGVHILRLRGGPRSRLRDFQPSNAPLFVPGLGSAIREQQPEAVIFFNVGWPLTTTPAILRLRKQSVVLYRTAYHPPDPSLPLGRLRQRVLVRTANLSHQLVSYSEHEKAQLVRDGRIPAHKVTAIYSGVDVVQPPVDRVSAFRRQHGLDGRCVLGHVARLSRYKGSDTLIRLLPTLRAETGQDVVLLLVGRNLEPDLLGNLAHECGVDEHVRFLGAVDEEELRLAYAAGDLFALPSQYESFGLVFLEAWAQGVPVVGCATGGVPELIHHGENGFLLEDAGQVNKLREYLVKLVQNPDMRKQMGEKGRERVRSEFTWPQCAHRFKELIRHLQEEQAASCKS